MLWTSPKKVDTQFWFLFISPKESGDSVPRTPWDFTL
jgi:hypothetical protein